MIEQNAYHKKNEYYNILTNNVVLTREKAGPKTTTLVSIRLGS